MKETKQSRWRSVREEAAKAHNQNQSGMKGHVRKVLKPERSALLTQDGGGGTRSQPETLFFSPSYSLGVVIGDSPPEKLH